MEYTIEHQGIKIEVNEKGFTVEGIRIPVSEEFNHGRAFNSLMGVINKFGENAGAAFRTWRRHIGDEMGEEEIGRLYRALFFPGKSYEDFISKLLADPSMTAAERIKAVCGRYCIGPEGTLFMR